MLTIAGLGLILDSATQASKDIKVVAVIGVIIIGVGVSLVLRNKSFLSGAKGEAMVSRVLAGYPDDWYVFNDVIIRDTQIDHILLCPKGVYAIETKHYRGTITGKAESPDWWQFIQSRQTRMYNPIRQSLHHAAALANYLRTSGYSQIWVEPVVVFSHSEVKLDVTSPKVPVICLSQLKEFLDNRKQIMSPQECAEISANLNTHIAGNTKKNRLLIRWLSISVFIIAILGGVWWVISERPVTTEAPKESVIFWQNASEYVGKTKTVQGKIVRTHIGDNAWYLNFDEDYKTNLVVVIFAKHFRNFPDGIGKYRNEVIRVTGIITHYKENDYNRPEIIIKSPTQIVVE
ncbi:MAG: NERD domain-containing protein [Nitrospinae bacterium]|nr:NERD domain-containing protein [Nitrospinota bacterium]